MMIYFIHFNFDSIISSLLTALFNSIFIYIRFKLFVLSALQALIAEWWRINTTTSINKGSNPWFAIHLTGHLRRRSPWFTPSWTHWRICCRFSLCCCYCHLWLNLWSLGRYLNFRGPWRRGWLVSRSGFRAWCRFLDVPWETVPVRVAFRFCSLFLLKLKVKQTALCIEQHYYKL